MKWFQLLKTHKFVNDLAGHVERLRELFHEHAVSVKDRTDKDREEALAAIAADTEALDTRIGERLEALCDELQKRMGALELASRDMLQDAEEINRAVARLHRREAEFTSMIDTRCRDIGAKIRESIVGDIERAADRASQAATEAKLVFPQAEAYFTGKLIEHKRLTDQKVGLLAGRLDEAADLVAKFNDRKTELLSEVDRRIAAARPRGRV